MKTELTLITPEIAQQLLKTNSSNRPIRERAVVELANLIKRGEWVATHQGIAIDQNGIFIDGQHRLLAIIKSGISCLMNVTTDAPVESFKVIDGIVPRSLADKTHLSMYAAQNMAFFIRFFENTGKPTPDQALLLYSKIGAVSDKLECLLDKKQKTFGSAGFRCGAIIQMLNGNINYVLTNYQDLLSANFENENNMIRTALKMELRNQYSVLKGAGTNQIHIMTKSFYILDPKNKNIVRPVGINNHEYLLEKTKEIMSKYL